MAGVSFMITVYNKAPYLRDLIATLRAQVGDFPREFVFVDDGSKDGGPDLLETLIQDLPNASLHRFANGGQAAASNRGFRLCTLPLIKPVDADDPLHPECALRLRQALLDHPAASLAWCDRIEFQDGEPPPAPPAIGVVAPRLDPDPLKALIRAVFANPTQFMTRRDLIAKTGGCDERVRHSMEYGLSLRLALEGPFVHVPAPLATLRLGMSGNLSANQQLTLEESVMALAHFFTDHPELPARYARYAAQRAATRAWLWRLRKANASPASRDNLRRVLAYLPMADTPRFLRACAAAIARPL